MWLLSIPILCSLYQWKQITFLYSDNFIQTKMAIIVNGFAIWWYYRNISRNGSGRELELRGDYTGHFVLLKDKIASDKRIGGRMSNIKLIKSESKCAWILRRCNSKDLSYRKCNSRRAKNRPPLMLGKLLPHKKNGKNNSRIKRDCLLWGSSKYFNTLCKW